MLLTYLQQLQMDTLHQLKSSRHHKIDCGRISLLDFSKFDELTTRTAEVVRLLFLQGMKDLETNPLSYRRKINTSGTTSNTSLPTGA